MYNEVIRTIANELIGAASAKVEETLAPHSNDPKKFLISQGIAMIGRRSPLLADIANKINQKYQAKYETVNKDESVNTGKDTTNHKASDVSNTNTTVNKDESVNTNSTNNQTSSDSSRNTSNVQSVVINTENTVKQLEDIKNVLQNLTTSKTSGESIINKNSSVLSSNTNNNNIESAIHETAGINVKNSSSSSSIIDILGSVAKDRIAASKHGKTLSLLAQHILPVISKSKLFSTIGSSSLRGLGISALKNQNGGLQEVNQRTDSLNESNITDKTVTSESDKKSSILSTISSGMDLKNGLGVAKGALNVGRSAMGLLNPVGKVAMAGAAGYTVGTGINSLISSGLESVTGTEGETLGSWLQGKFGQKYDPNAIYDKNGKVIPKPADKAAVTVAAVNAKAAAEKQAAIAASQQASQQPVIINNSSTQQQSNSNDSFVMLSPRNKESTFERVQMQDYWSRSV